MVVRLTLQYFGGAVEAVFERRADRAEGRQSHPTCLQGAAAGHAVTFTLLLLLQAHVLQTEHTL